MGHVNSIFPVRLYSQWSIFHDEDMWDMLIFGFRSILPTCKQHILNMRLSWVFTAVCNTGVNGLQAAQRKSPHLWSEGETRLLLIITKDVDISWVLDVHKYHNADLFEKVVEQMKEGGCVYRSMHSCM